MASNEITVSVKDTEVFANLLESSFEFFAWYNKTHQQQPSNHPEHPWCKLGQVLDDMHDRGITQPLMSSPASAVVMRPEWLRAIAKAASSIRFTANNWEWVSDVAREESMSIADTLAEIEAAYVPRCKECGYTAEDAAIYMDHHLCSGKIPSA